MISTPDDADLLRKRIPLLREKLQRATEEGSFGVPLGIVERVEEREGTIWAAGINPEGAPGDIFGVPLNYPLAEMIREFPLGSRATFVTLADGWELVMPGEFDEVQESFEEMIEALEGLLEEYRLAEETTDTTTLPAEEIFVMTCSNCNASLTEGAKFCSNCGAPNGVTPVAPPPVATAPDHPKQDIDHGSFIEKADGGFHLKNTDDASIRAYIQYLRTARPNWTEISLGGSGRVLVYAASVAVGYDWALSPETKANVIENLRRDEALTREFPTLANMVGVPIAPAKPGIALTAKEQEHLLWEPGDWYEVVPGNISFTSSRMFALSVHGKNEHVMKTFFFDPNPPSDWDSQEWSFASPVDLPNGPSLLVLLRRGNQAEVFGIVSMVNRAWAHVFPLAASGMIEHSSRFKNLNKQVFKSVAKNVAKASPWMLVPVVGSIIVQSKVANAPSESRETIEELAATARLLMHRIAASADKYWGDGPGSSTGRL